MNIKAGNFAIVKPDPSINLWAILPVGRTEYIRDYLSPHEVGTSLIELERDKLYKNGDTQHIGNALECAIDRIKRDMYSSPEQDIQSLVECGALIAEYIDRLISEKL